MRNVLQSLFSMQLMFALLNAAPRDPLQMEVMCDEAGFVTVTPQKGGSPPVPRSPGGLSTPGGRAPASFTSLLIKVQRAHRAACATSGRRSADLGFLRKSQPA